MAIRVYQYAKCSTCRKALSFLKDKGVKFDAIDIVNKPPSAAELKRAQELAGVPVRKLFNTSGQSYREGGYSARAATMSDKEIYAALAADGKLIKRPLLVADDFALVGFSEADYSERFSK